MSSSSHASGTRSAQRGAVLLGIAGGMLVVAGGFTGAYFMTGSRSVASAATTPESGQPNNPKTSGGDASKRLSQIVTLKAGAVTAQLTWAELGAIVEKDDGNKSGDLASSSLALDREKATKALLAIKAKTDKSAIDAHLDLENHKILPDAPGQGLDVWGSLAQIAAAARSGSDKIDLLTVAIPASVTQAGLGIDDISEVMGHWETQFPVSDRDRNFNLKLAASKLNGVVLKPGAEWSFNETVGERSQKNGYKIAHVINAGEMVDGLAGGTCQISTTLYGAAFFAGIDIVKTTNHSRPSAYTPFGFDATVVWPNTDLKLKNPYDFPVVIRYVVANGQAAVQVLGKKRPYDKIVFTRTILEEEEFKTEERLDDELAKGEETFDQEGFPGYKILKTRQFYKGNKVVKTEKWNAVYKPVTEYIRRGTNEAPDAKKVVAKESHSLHKPSAGSSGFSQ